MTNEFWQTQMNHKRTKGYYESLKRLIDELTTEDETKIYEILVVGLDVGISARCFLEQADIILTSVDPGDVDIGIREIGLMNVGDRWKFHHMRSDEYFAECQKQYDVIYIDGDHSYEQCSKDINNAWKFIKTGGWLIGHDILHFSNFRNDRDIGVTQAFAEFIKEYDLEAHIYPPYPCLIVIKKI